MGVVSQIKDLDNSSKALPYKSSATSTVGEGLAPPETQPTWFSIQRPAAGAPQWRLANRRHACPLLERCCMGVVSQIKDLDNSSKALPYKSSATSTVGEGLAPPETLPIPIDSL